MSMSGNYQVNYSQINQLCSITDLLPFGLFFHCMLFITHSFKQLSKLHELHPDQHTQTKKKVGLRDRDRFRINPLCPSYLFCSLPHECLLQPSFFFLFFFFSKAAMQSRVQVISQDSPLDGSMSQQALIDT